MMGVSKKELWSSIEILKSKVRVLERKVDHLKDVTEWQGEVNLTLLDYLGVYFERQPEQLVLKKKEQDKSAK